MRHPAILVVIATLTACVSEPPSEPSPCASTVALSQSGRNPPTFSWRPSCGLGSLVVRDSTTDSLLWSIAFTLPSNLMGPPVPYGGQPRFPDCAAPINATACDLLLTQPAQQLSAGTTYRVEVARWARDSVVGDHIVSAGTLYFRP